MNYQLNMPVSDNNNIEKIVKICFSEQHRDISMHRLSGNLVFTKKKGKLKLRYFKTTELLKIHFPL